jgi:hypothetical protein
VGEERNKQLRLAELLNDASVLIHSTHQGLKWINFLTPCKEDLSKLQADLSEAIATIQKVLDE